MGSKGRRTSQGAGATYASDERGHRSLSTNEGIARSRRTRASCVYEERGATCVCEARIECMLSKSEPRAQRGRDLASAQARWGAWEGGRNVGGGRGCTDSTSTAPLPFYISPFASSTLLFLHLPPLCLRLSLPPLFPTTSVSSPSSPPCVSRGTSPRKDTYGAGRSRSIPSPRKTTCLGSLNPSSSKYWMHTLPRIGQLLRASSAIPPCSCGPICVLTLPNPIVMVFDIRKHTSAP